METSCEEFNMLIDRASVTHSDEIGYFDLYILIKLFLKVISNQKIQLIF